LCLQHLQLDAVGCVHDRCWSALTESNSAAGSACQVECSQWTASCRRLKPYLVGLNAPQYKLLFIYYNRAVEGRKAQRRQQV
jgi:hypothetical protein